MRQLVYSDRLFKVITIAVFLAVVYFYARTIDQALHIDATNCGCPYPGCGCLQITLVPYNAQQDLPDWSPLQIPTVPPTQQAAPAITKQPLP